MTTSHLLELDSIKKQKDKLWCNKWSDASWVSYLNLINYESIKPTNWIPWGNIPTLEKDVLQHCKSQIYSLYKYMTLKHVQMCPVEQIHAYIDKLLHVYNLSGADGVELYRELIELLAARDCPFPEVLSDIWKTVCHSERAKEFVFETALNRNSTMVLSYTLRVAQKVKFGFWGARFRQSAFPSIRYCPVTDAVLNGKVEHLKMLLKNGFQPNVHRLCTYDKVFKASINPAYCWMRTPLTQPSTSARRKVLTEVLLFLLLLYQSSSQSLRFQVILCFNLLWDNISTSMVSRAELDREVAGRFGDRPPEVDLTESAFRQQLKIILPRSDPRPLQQLCRCRLRRSLAQNLPDGVRELYLPKTLRDYVAEV